MNKKLNLIVESLPKKDDQIDIVERKGLGHPDTICDLLVDYLSIRLSQIYKKEFGFIPHFNIDKALLAAGETENRLVVGKLSNQCYLSLVIELPLKWEKKRLIWKSSSKKKSLFF